MHAVPDPAPPSATRLPAPQELPLAEAAAVLGLAPETLRKQLARGKAQGRKVDGTWWVPVPDRVPDRPASAPVAAGPLPDTVPDPVPDTAGHVPDHAGPLPDPPSLLVETLQSEVAFLREELRRVGEQHAQDRAEWHHRLQEALFALAQRPALPEPREKAPSSESLESLERSRPWWTWLLWWRRG